MIRQAILLGDTSGVGHHGSQTAIENLYCGLKRNDIIVQRSHNGKNWERNPRLRRQVKDCDVLIVNGEGTLHHDRPIARQLVAAAEFASGHSVPSVLVNTLWHFNSRELAKSTARFNLRFVRDRQSEVELRSYGVSSILTGDLTLLSGSVPCRRNRSGQITVTDSADRQVSQLLWKLSSDPALSRLPIINRSSCKNKTRTIDRFRRLLQGRMAKICTPEFHRQVRERWLPFGAPSGDAFVERLSRSRLIISGRYHAVCFCLLTKTPFIAIPSNGRKVEALLSEAGCNPGRCIPREELPTDLAGFPTSCEFSTVETHCIDRYLQSVRSRNEDMFAQISELCRTNDRHNVRVP